MDFMQKELSAFAILMRHKFQKRSALKLVGRINETQIWQATRSNIG